MCSLEDCVLAATGCAQYSSIKHVPINTAKQRLATGSNTVEGEIFCTRPERTLVLPSLLYTGYPVFPWNKVDGA